MFCLEGGSRTLVVRAEHFIIMRRSIVFATAVRGFNVVAHWLLYISKLSNLTSLSDPNLLLYTYSSDTLNQLKVSPTLKMTSKQNYSFSAFSYL